MHGGCWMVHHPNSPQQLCQHQYGYLSKPIIINVSGVFTPINPSYFDVHQGYKVLTQSHMSVNFSLRTSFCACRWPTKQFSWYLESMAIIMTPSIPSELRQGCCASRVQEGFPIATWATPRRTGPNRRRSSTPLRRENRESLRLVTLGSGLSSDWIGKMAATGFRSLEGYQSAHGWICSLFRSCRILAVHPNQWFVSALVRWLRSHSLWTDGTTWRWPALKAGRSSNTRESVEMRISLIQIQDISRCPN